MKAHISSNRPFSGSAVLTPLARLLSHKRSAVKLLQAPRLHRYFKQPAAAQSSELASRVPDSTAEHQQVRLLLSTCSSAKRDVLCLFALRFLICFSVASTSYSA